MWNRLKRWILFSSAKRPVRRRERLLRFGGQVERLEARTMLSASVAAMPTDFEMGAAGLWESAYAEASMQPRFPLAAIAVPHWDNVQTLVSGGWHNDLGRFNQPVWGPISAGTIAPLPQGPVYVVAVITIHAPSSVPPVNQSQPLAATSEPAPPAIPAPLAATGPFADSHDDPPPPSPQMARSPVAVAGSFLNSQVVLEFTTHDASTPAAIPVAAREAAFQEYASSKLLLLAASVDGWHDTNFDRLNNDLEASADQEQEEFTELNDLGLNDGVAASLDTLERELEAIDAVLSELHDLNIHTDGPKNDTVQESRQPNAKPLLSARDDISPTNSAKDIQPPQSDPAEGGMVLLEPRGDANLSAYDLADVFTSRLEGAVETLLGLEVSVGVYQVFDIGGREMQPSTNNAASAAPSAASRSSVSEEEVNRKAGEQPS